MNFQNTIEQILDLARWAPSGDNTQPWRFEIIDAQHVVVHGFDTRSHCVYDLDGHPSQISIGALLETIAIAATGHGLETKIVRRIDAPEITPTFDVSFLRDPSVLADPLIDCIRQRSVQRRAMSRHSLTLAQKQSLETCTGSNFQVVWLEGTKSKLDAALLMFESAKLRLTLPEAYLVHRDVIEWNSRYSADRVPDQALGVDPLTTRLMRFVMHSWKRVEFFNTFLAGTWGPRIQMDLLPGLACGAHFVLLARHLPRGTDDFISAGRAVQRFWLKTTQLGLVMQPEITPLIFSRYSRDKLTFSTTAGMAQHATALAKKFEALIGADSSNRAVFMGRVGSGSPAMARSTRLELAQLMLDKSSLVTSALLPKPMAGSSVANCTTHANEPFDVSAGKA